MKENGVEFKESNPMNFNNWTSNKLDTIHIFKNIKKPCFIVGVIPVAYRLHSAMYCTCSC